MNTHLPLRLRRSRRRRGFFFGTFTGDHSQGIYVAGWDAVQGELSAPRLAAALPHPPHLAVHPLQERLYAVSQRNPGRLFVSLRMACWIISGRSLREVQ